MEKETERPKAFLSIKFSVDRQYGEDLIRALEEAGLEILCLVRDEGWETQPRENPVREALMMIDKSQMLILDATGETGFGMGIEAGYAFAKGIPIVALCHHPEALKITRKEIAAHILQFKLYEELTEKMRAMLKVWQR